MGDANRACCNPGMKPVGVRARMQSNRAHQRR